jgi:holo-[acyl-carrier protein] synthase
MNIIGLGFDATDIPRIASTLERYGDRFLQRVFTEGEIAYCTRRRNPAPHLAGRFAAKEACMKALGTGYSCGVIWKDIEVVRDDGPPQLRLHGGAALRAEQMRVAKSLLTITHADALAMAQVMLLAADDTAG